MTTLPNAPALPLEAPPSLQPGWLSVVTHLDPRFGGLSAVVPQLSSQIAAVTGRSVGIAAFCEPGELFAPPSNRRITLTEWPAGRKAWWSDRTLGRRFQQVIDASTGLHIHGLWEQSTLIACRAARRSRKPYLISAHGMLERWALQNKRLKKWIYSALVERQNLQSAACLHALTAAEAEDYRRFGCTAPIVVIPNGVRIPDRVSSDLFLAQHPTLRGKRLVLFLGRIHFKKGLDLLVDAWQRIAAEYPQTHLVLAGPDFEGTRATIAARIAERGIADRVLFAGMLREELKWSALAAAEAFVLPSYSEGLSVSVLEALGIGLPVIVSDACNLPEVATIGAGWVIRPEVSPLEQALRELLDSSPGETRGRAAAGRQFVRDRYSWSTVARQMGEVYDWVSGGPTPQSVDVLYRTPGRPA